MSQAIVDVAVAIIRNAQGHILVNERQHDKEHAGQWEFPGGKFADNESASQALKRECYEELGIKVLADSALIELVHEYPNKIVRLHVREVQEFHGDPQSMEEQTLAWMSLGDLKEFSGLLPADIPIIKALEMKLSS